MRLFPYFFFALLLGGLSPGSLRAQDTSVMQQWQQFTQNPGLADFFEGLFQSIGIEVKDSDEAFTVYLQEGEFELQKGIDRAEVDYVVEVNEANVADVMTFGEDANIDRVEGFRIIRVLFSPLTRAALDNPQITSGFKLWLGGIDQEMHVYLLGPEGKRIDAHTLLFHEGHWYVIPGIHGPAERVFRLEFEDALAFQRRMYQAQKTNTNRAWRQFRNWYVEWREGVSEKS
jgi:hypothetical protein